MRRNKNVAEIVTRIIIAIFVLLLIYLGTIWKSM